MVKQVYPQELLRHGLCSALSAAQAGELPLFVWTLGLPQEELLTVVRFCLPRLGAVQPMPDAQYHLLLKQVPTEVNNLVKQLLEGCANSASKQEAHWLAHILACLCWTHASWWQALALNDAHEMEQLLQYYLPDFYARHKSQREDWKKCLIETKKAPFGSYLT